MRIPGWLRHPLGRPQHDHSETIPLAMLRMVSAERDHAHSVLRALRLAGHVPEGAWRRLVNCTVAIASEGDGARAEAAAMAIVWRVEQDGRITR